MRKETIFKHDRKVGLVVKSVQYSTYTETIVRIPTVYQLVTARQNSQSKKPTYFEKRNNLHDRKVGLVVKSVQYSTYTDSIPTCHRKTELTIKKTTYFEK